MRWFNKTNKVDTVEALTGNGASFIAGLLGENRPTITRNDLLKVSAAKACVSLIVDKIGSVPMYLYKENEDGSVERIYGDHREELINGNSNEYLPAGSLMPLIVTNYLNEGNGYAEIERDGQNIVAIHPLSPSEVTPKITRKSGKVVVEYEYDGQNHKYYNIINVANMTADGVNGLGVRELGSDIISAADYTVRSIRAQQKRGGMLGGFIKFKMTLPQEEAQSIVSAANKKYETPESAAHWAGINDSADFTFTQKENSDHYSALQALNQEIAKMYGVPYGMISSSAVNKNDEQALFNNVISPITAKIEKVFSSILLSDKEIKEGCYFRFDSKEFVRPNEAEKVDNATKLLASGGITLNEFRAMLDLPKLTEEEEILFGHSGQTYVRIHKGENGEGEIEFVNAAQDAPTQEKPVAQPTPIEQEKTEELDE